MTDKEIKSCIGTIEMLRRLAYNIHGVMDVIDADNCEKIIKVLEQEPKTGHWIMPVQDDGMSDPIYYQVRCSKCGFDLDPQTWHMELHQYGADKYCPKCGAKMESEE